MNEAGEVAVTSSRCGACGAQGTPGKFCGACGESIAAVSPERVAAGGRSRTFPGLLALAAVTIVLVGFAAYRLVTPTSVSLAELARAAGTITCESGNGQVWRYSGSDRSMTRSGGGTEDLQAQIEFQANGATVTADSVEGRYQLSIEGTDEIYLDLRVPIQVQYGEMETTVDMAAGQAVTADPNTSGWRCQRG